MKPERLHVVLLARAIYPVHGYGGLERHAHDFVRHLLRHGLCVTLITQPPKQEATGAFEFPDPERLTVRFVPYRTFPLAGRRGTTVLDRSTAYPFFGLRAGRLAASLVRRGGVQLVHGLGASTLGYARARARDRLGTVPLVFNPHGLEEFGATNPSRARLKRLAYRPLQLAVRTCARAADRVVATDRSLVATVLAHLGIPAARVAVVPNAVDLEGVDRLTNPEAAVRRRRDLGLGPDDVLLLSVGRLERNKGFQDLIPALAELRQRTSTETSGVLAGRWRWVLLGDGPYRSRLEHALDAHALREHAVLPGRVSDAELHAWYEAATLFVHPTLYEGSSLVTLEAMTHRRAVVASAAGGLPDKVKPGVTGWLVEPGNPAALAHALREALAHRHRLGDMGREARALIEREFSWSVVTLRWLDLYAEVLAGGPGSGMDALS